METMQSALWRPMHFPDAERVVAGVAQQLRQLHGVMFRHRAVPEHAVAPRRHTCEQCGACRGAGRSGRIGAAEPDTTSGEPVEIRRLDYRIPTGAQTVAAM